MPIASYKHNEPKHRIDERLQPTPKIINTPVEFDSLKPLTSLLQYVEGAAWKVDYYRQIIPDTITTDILDTSVDNPYQQFEKIEGLKIKVQSPLTSSYDESDSTTKITGSSLIPSIIVPNVNDYLVVDIETSTKAILRIFQVERKSHLKESVYEVNYSVIAYSNITPGSFKTLESKVVKTYHYDEELQVTNIKPLLTTYEKHNKNSLVGHYRDILLTFCRNFYRRELSMFLLPSQNYKIYDPFYMNFIYTHISRTETKELNNSYLPSLDDINEFNTNTIFTVIKERNYSLFSSVNKRHVLIHRKKFINNPWARNVRMTMLDYIVVPWVDDYSLYNENDKEILRYFNDITLYEKNINETKNHQGFLSSMLNFNVQQGDLYKRIIHPTLIDDYYIFSKEFYDCTTETSILEDLLTNYMKNNTVSVDDLYKLIQIYNSMARLEQFYYTGFILLLIKEAIKSDVWGV